MRSQESEGIAAAYRQSRPELRNYVTRMVVRAEIAEEIVQQAALKLLEAAERPTDANAVRAWLFRVATNLAIDHLRRHSTWREQILVETRERANQDDAFVAQSKLMIGSPEMAAIAREHLAVCLSCTLKNLPPEQAAAILLIEVYGFTVTEAAEMLGATFAQTKNWVQNARAVLRAKYESTCALITKQGVCHQCLELSDFFNGRKEDPLANTARDIDARLEILRQQRATTLGPWHTLMMRIVDDLLHQ